MNSQFGNYNSEYEAYLKRAIMLASSELLEKAEKYNWPRETIAEMILGKFKDI